MIGELVFAQNIECLKGYREIWWKLKSITAHSETINLSLETVLFAEGKGIFDVVFEGKLVFSKYETGRFPDKGEVTRIIQEL